MSQNSKEWDDNELFGNIYETDTRLRIDNRSKYSGILRWANILNLENCWNRLYDMLDN